MGSALREQGLPGSLDIPFRPVEACPVARCSISTGKGIIMDNPFNLAEFKRWIYSKPLDSVIGLRGEEEACPTAM